MTVPNTPIRKSFFAGLVVLTLVAAFLRMYGLTDIPPLGDEADAAKDAFDYMQRGHFGVVMWQHPKLRNILLYVSLNTFGLNLVGLKFMCVTFGTMTVPLLAIFARHVTKSDAAALLSGLFLAIDALHIDLSRQAILEVSIPFFAIAAIYMALLYLCSIRRWLLIVSGLSFGLGLAGKWYVAFPLLVILGLLTAQSLMDKNLSAGDKARELLFYVSTLIILPCTVYLLSYYPWFLHRGYDFVDWFATQRIMYNENLVHQGFNPVAVAIQDRKALLWFVRPVGLVDFLLTPQKPFVLLGMTNPFVWLLTLPAVFHLMFKVYRIKALNSIILLALFWSLYLPFAVVQRPVFTNSALAVAPFAMIIVASFVVTILKGSLYRRQVFAIYMFFVLSGAFPLYFLAIGKGYGTILHPIIELYRPLNER